MTDDLERDLRDAMEGMFNGFRQNLLEGLQQQNRMFSIARGIDPDNEPTVLVERPRDPRWIAARDAYTARWNTLVDEGIENEWLEARGGEMGVEYEPTTDTTEWIEQPNPDYDPDRPNPYALPSDQDHITIPKAGQ